MVKRVRRPTDRQESLAPSKIAAAAVVPSAIFFSLPGLCFSLRSKDAEHIVENAQFMHIEIQTSDVRDDELNILNGSLILKEEDGRGEKDRLNLNKYN